MLNPGFAQWNGCYYCNRCEIATEVSEHVPSRGHGGFDWFRDVRSPPALHPKFSSRLASAQQNPSSVRRFGDLDEAVTVGEPADTRLAMVDRIVGARAGVTRRNLEFASDAC